MSASRAYFTNAFEIGFHRSSEIAFQLRLL